MADESLKEDLVVDIGRSDGARTFVGVVHLPTGRDCCIIEGRGQNTREIANKLLLGLLREFTADKMTS